ncbi:hypothetical protein D3C72_2098850 [compost metagenome]
MLGRNRRATPTKPSASAAAMRPEKRSLSHNTDSNARNIGEVWLSVIAVASGKCTIA